MKKTPSNGTGIFTENRNGIELYHLQNTDKAFAFSGEEAWHGTGIKFTQFGRSGIKIDASEKITFFPCKNFHQNELFPLEFVPESGVDHYRAFHTKGVKLSARSF